MNVIIDKIIQKVSDRKMNRTKYKVKRLKTVFRYNPCCNCGYKDENSGNPCCIISIRR